MEMEYIPRKRKKAEKSRPNWVAHTAEVTDSSSATPTPRFVSCFTGRNDFFVLAISFDRRGHFGMKSYQSYQSHTSVIPEKSFFCGVKERTK